MVQAAAGLKSDLEKLTSSAAVGVEAELATMTARRKELSSKNVRHNNNKKSCLLVFYYKVKSAHILYHMVHSLPWKGGEL